MEPTPETKPFFSWLRNRFLTGLFTVLPVLLTYWIIRFVYNVVNGPADRYIRALVENHLLPGSDYFLAHHEGTIPGAGFAVTLLLIFLIGIVASHLVGQRFFHFLETIFLRIPVVKVIYQALRQAVQAVQQIGGDPSAGATPSGKSPTSPCRGARPSSSASSRAGLSTRRGRPRSSSSFPMRRALWRASSWPCRRRRSSWLPG